MSTQQIGQELLFNYIYGCVDSPVGYDSGLCFMEGKDSSNYSSSNLDAIYNGWSSQITQNDVYIDFGTIKYTNAGQAGKDKLINDRYWTITDGGI